MRTAELARGARSRSARRWAATAARVEMRRRLLRCGRDVRRPPWQRPRWSGDLGMLGWRCGGDRHGWRSPHRGAGPPRTCSASASSHARFFRSAKDTSASDMPWCIEVRDCMNGRFSGDGGSDAVCAVGWWSYVLRTSDESCQTGPVQQPGCHVVGRGRGWGGAVILTLSIAGHGVP